MKTARIPRRWWCLAGVSLGVAILLPCLGRLVRQRPASRCAFDGAAVDRQIMVQVMTGEGRSLSFCSVSCAEWWLEASGDTPKSILVTDEVSGESLPYTAASYVRSSVIAHEPTGERRHVFRSRADAEKHAAEHRGRLLERDERPFQLRRDARSREGNDG